MDPKIVQLVATPPTKQPFCGGTLDLQLHFFLSSVFVVTTNKSSHFCFSLPVAALKRNKGSLSPEVTGNTLGVNQTSLPKSRSIPWPFNTRHRRGVSYLCCWTSKTTTRSQPRPGSSLCFSTSLGLSFGLCTSFRFRQSFRFTRCFSFSSNGFRGHHLRPCP